MSNPIPGWYPDPDNGTRHRYWDGDAWTENIRYDLEFVNADEDEILEDDVDEDADEAFDVDSYGVEDSSFSSYEGGAVAVDEPAFAAPDTSTFDAASGAGEDAAQIPGAAALQEVWKRPKWLKGAAAAAGAVAGRMSDAQAPEEPEFPEAPEVPGLPDFASEDPQATAVFGVPDTGNATDEVSANLPGFGDSHLAGPADTPSFGGQSGFPSFGAQTPEEPEAFFPEEPTFEAPAAPVTPQQTQPVWPQETSTSAWSALLRRTEPQVPALTEAEEAPLASGPWEGEGTDEVAEEESGPSFGVSLPTSKLPKKSPLRRGLAGASGLFGRAKEALSGDEDEAPAFEAPEFGDGAAGIPGLAETDLGTEDLGAVHSDSGTFGAPTFTSPLGNADLGGGDRGGAGDVSSPDFASPQMEAAGFDIAGVDGADLDASELQAPEGEFEMPEVPGGALKAAGSLRSALGRTSLFGRKRNQEEDTTPAPADDLSGTAPALGATASTAATDFPSEPQSATPWDGADESVSDEQVFASVGADNDRAASPSLSPALVNLDDRHGAPALEATTVPTAKANPWQLAVLATGAALLLVVIAIIGVLIHSATLGPRLEDARAKLNEAQQSVVDAQNELTQAEQESGGSQ